MNEDNQKAISLWQPWASLICLGLKQYETRNWQTSYRGQLVICSAKKRTRQQQQTFTTLAEKHQIDTEWNNLPFGYAIAVCDLSDCMAMTKELIQEASETEKECGDWQAGRFAWKLDNIRVFDNPISVKGKQRLWNIQLSLPC